MIDIDELVERLESVADHSDDGVATQVADDAITALQEMQKENASLKLANKVRPESYERQIAELEETLTKSIGNCDHWIQKYERLDAALAEIHDILSVVDEKQCSANVWDKVCIADEKAELARAGD